MRYKKKMINAPILVFPDWNIEFHVHLDASGIVLGAVLVQPGVILTILSISPAGSYRKLNATILPRSKKG